GKGNDKGNVEGLVGYARRNFMVPVPRCASWEELNEHLLQECRPERTERLFAPLDHHRHRAQNDLFSKVRIQIEGIDRPGAAQIEGDRHIEPPARANLHHALTGRRKPDLPHLGEYLARRLEVRQWIGGMAQAPESPLQEVINGILGREFRTHPLYCRFPFPVHWLACTYSCTPAGTATAFVSLSRSCSNGHSALFGGHYSLIGRWPPGVHSESAFVSHDRPVHHRHPLL
ncbi:MAG: hypothetical protein FJW30_30530, partial [Acidobacteria bacterium]|nr:hypothetical protein [Acidobacteriota bacterium]